MKIPVWLGIVAVVALVVVWLRRAPATKEGFEAQCKAKTSCPGGYRSDGPCLMEFPSF